MSTASFAAAFLADVQFEFRKQRSLADKALAQVDDAAFFHKPAEFSNSIAMIVKHVAGNLRSRWTDFLTSDGDKPDRDRDGEFVIGERDTRESLSAAWADAWTITLAALAALSGDDLAKSVAIRGETHSVIQAIQRNLTHTAYHVGQITYLAKLGSTGEWKWITIAPKPLRPAGASPRPYLQEP